MTETEALNLLRDTYERKKGCLCVSSQIFKDEYYDYILKKYKRLKAGNASISLSKNYIELFFKKMGFEEKTRALEKMISFGEFLLNKIPRIPIFDNRSEFVMFFIRYYFINNYNKKETLLETDEYIIVDGKKYKKRGIA